MKKICFLILFPLIFLFLFSGCKNTFSLTPYVSELKSQSYIASAEGFKLKAYYGFKEEPYVNDGKVGQTVSRLTVKLIEFTGDNVTYSLELFANGKDYKQDFKYNPVLDVLYLSFEIENFLEKSFTAVLSFADVKINLSFESELPENTKTYEEVTKILLKEQPTLINSLISDGIFNAELHLRIIVKNSHPYWYVGIASESDRLKAFLVDGISGEILAIREIF